MQRINAIMTSPKKITADVRSFVVKLNNEKKKSFSEISKLFNLSKSTVQTIFKNYIKTIVLKTSHEVDVRQNLTFNICSIF